jgi:hypothetical protein
MVRIGMMRIGDRPGPHRQQAIDPGLPEQTKIDRLGVRGCIFSKAHARSAVFSLDQLQASLQFCSAALHFVAQLAPFKWRE